MNPETARSISSDLVPPGFRTRSDELPRSKPPRWMTWAWITTLIATVGCLAATLLGPMDEFVFAEGVVQPADYALVFPTVAGTVSEVPVRSGDRVKAGQVLCRIDATDLLAPADGLLVSQAVNFPGEQVALGSAMFKIAKSAAIRLQLHASEDRINRITPGMLVRFRPRSDPNRLSRLLAGKVISAAPDRDLISEGAANAGMRGTYTIDVSVDDHEAGIPLGATVDAEIVLAQRPFWRVLLIKPGSPGR